MTNNTMRVAVCGAGPAGLVTASILSREAPSGTFEIDVFERQDRERDQGAGWDIDARGQAILRRAGVDPSIISREGSDMVRMFHASAEESEGKQPWLAIGKPSYLAFLGGDDPETNRHLLREELLKAVDGQPNPVSVRFSCGISAVHASADDKTETVELIGEDGSCLGEYDLVIDASGIHSPLRQALFADSAAGTLLEQSFTGFTILHGAIEAPEASVDPLLVKRLGEGTMVTFGPHTSGRGGRSFSLQRFGAAHSDQRCSFAWAHRSQGQEDQPPRAQTLSAELGLDPARTFFSTDHDPEGFATVKQFIKGEMGAKWDPMYHRCVDALSSIAIRQQHMLPAAPRSTAAATSLPVVCIGDALHAVPAYTGKGGNTALADSADIATSLLAYAAATVAAPACPVPVPTLPELLRRDERRFLARVADEAGTRELPTRRRMEWMWGKGGFDPAAHCTVGAFATCGGDWDEEGYGWTWEKRAAVLFVGAFTWLNALEGFGMGKGAAGKRALADGSKVAAGAHQAGRRLAAAAP